VNGRDPAISRTEVLFPLREKYDSGAIHCARVLILVSPNRFATALSAAADKRCATLRSKAAPAAEDVWRPEGLRHIGHGANPQKI
jgi:hypothetical protein